MDIALPIIAFSLVLQLASVFLTVRLIVYRGKPVVGVIVLLTIILMVFRRIISFYRLVQGADIKTDLAAESIGCTVSFTMLLGIIFVGRLISSVRTLSGLLPICYSCKKIKDEKGSWKNVEAYVEEHSKAEFSHGLCPDCGKNYRAEVVAFIDRKQAVRG